MNRQYLSKFLVAGLLMCGVADAQMCSNFNIMETTPTSDFTFHIDGTVTHNTTGLVWKRCLEGEVFSDNATPDNFLDDKCTGAAATMNWQAAMDQAKLANDSNFGGHCDWRVPNLKELKSTVEYCKGLRNSSRFVAANTVVFPSLVGFPVVWSSSPAISDNVIVTSDVPANSAAWAVYFNLGDAGRFFRKANLATRLVRSSE
ncbi:DUF1566 domain-containing protein [Thiothrix winogradskyi]|uniref:DUF1566 domain-containing protein n=1 Tax=Thiothrix winogradskyi TaxID=96472 RepID=A0ABY3STI6_9GAMM|nr:DUF1566 domain-containing protein [Thiothrix winogradskyi]UJS22798.1 DUF1566 domain-containing protein [Thiothrix winogradskyi]